MRPSGNDYRVATLSKSYLTVIGIIMQSLDNSNMSKLTKRANRLALRTYERTFTNHEKASRLKMEKILERNIYLSNFLAFGIMVLFLNSVNKTSLGLKQDTPRNKPICPPI